jgi:hypothetical protein
LLEWARSVTPGHGLLHGTAGRRRKKKAIVAVGRSTLLADPGARYANLGRGFYDTGISCSQDAQPRRQLEALGCTVILEPAA